MPDLIDTHCHLAHQRFSQQVSDVLDRARAAGVRDVICAAGNLRESEAALRIARHHRGVTCMAGVHPHDAKAAAGNYLARVEQLAAAERNVAIGEIGLDYHYEYSPRDVQRRVFGEQLALARRCGKPVVIHTREAFDETLAMIVESGIAGERVVFHSFTGGAGEARRALDAGASISFSGIVTFRKADDIRRAALLVPDDRILVETDAPFLCPEPVRKMKTNEPANVAHTAAFLADLRRAGRDPFAQRTAANARRFFALP
jgi:TatD DNase family protein